MSLSVRIATAALLLAMASAFLVFDISVFREFTPLFSYRRLVLGNGHIILFFSTLGLILLLLLFAPTSIVLDFYWNRLPLGRVRLVVGIIVAGMVCYLFSAHYAARRNTSVWAIAPHALLEEEVRSARCGNQCERPSIVYTQSRLMEVFSQRNDLANFVQFCESDQLVESKDAPQRYCFAADRTLPVHDCCRAKRKLTDAIGVMTSDPQLRSASSRIFQSILPAYVFVGLLSLFVGVFLGRYRYRIDELYGGMVPMIERSLILIASLILLWAVLYLSSLRLQAVIPGIFISQQTYVQEQLLIYLLMGIWLIGVLLFFTRRLAKAIQERVLGLLLSALAIGSYDKVIDLAATRSLEVIAGTFLLFLAATLFVVLGPRKPYEQDQSDRAGAS